MTRRARSLLLILVGGVAAALPVGAQDSVEGALRRDQPVPLRWDNVEGAPAWVSGVEPSYNLLKRLHTVELAPGESICVRIPANEALRIVGSDDPLSYRDIEIAISNGSGLLAFTEPVTEEAGTSLRVNPKRPYPMLAHVRRPAAQQKALRVSLFTSRHVPLDDLAGYRHLVDLGSAHNVHLTASADADPLQFWRWDRGPQPTVQVRGPARFRLETRYRYPPHEQALQQTYHILVRDEDRRAPIATVEYATSQETAQVVKTGGEAQVVSRVAAGYFDLDEDRTYRITLDTTAAVFVRMLQLDKSDYLLPSLNAPDARPGDVAEDLRPTRFQQSLWDLSEAELPSLMDDPANHPAETVERAAMRLARDNQRREGGMMAAGLLANAGAARPNFPDIRARAREFAGFRTYLRDVLPEGADLPPLKRAYYPARTLQHIGEARDSLVLGTQLIDAGFRRLPHATFSPILPFGAKGLYRLPEHASPSIIRVAAERDRDQPADFTVQIPGKFPLRFRLLPQPELPWRDTKPTQGEAALQLIQGDTLDAPAASRREPDNLVPAGYVEFVVPTDVRQLEVRQAEGGKDLPIAIQVRVSDVFALSEDEDRAVISNLDDPGRVFPLLVDFLTDPAEARAAQGFARPEQELFNHWEPLQRFVRSRYRQFADSVAPDGSMDPTAARLRDIDPLIADGEFFLAERLARYLYLYGEPGVRRDARARLRRIAQHHLDSERQVINACAAMVVQPDVGNLASLCRLLRKTGEEELALMLAMALPNGEPSTRDLRLACTFAEGWWAQFAAILEEQPNDPVCHQWRAHQWWRQGRYQDARHEWERAGKTGQPWLAHVDATQAARKRLRTGDTDALNQWARLETTHPGEKIWAPLNYQHVRSSQGGVSLRARERETYSPAFIATPDQPVQLEIPSPRLLRIECRPLHPADATVPLEGWVYVDDGHVRRRLPVIANYRSPGLELVGLDREQPGTAVWDELDIDGWNTRLRIRPTQGRMIVRVWNKRPEFPVGHLPPLGYETAARLISQTTPSPNDHDFGTVVAVSPEHKVTKQKIRAPFANPSAKELNVMRAYMDQLDPVPQPLTRTAQRQAMTKTAKLLWVYERSNPRRQQSIIAAASAYGDRHRVYPEVGRIHAKIVRQAQWEPVLVAEQGAGLSEVELAGWIPENPTLLRRMAQLPKLNEQEQLISGTDSLVAVLAHKEANTVRLRLALEIVPYLIPKPLRARLQWGEESAQELALSSRQPEQQFTFRLPAGETSLRVEVLESEPNHFLKVAIDADNDRELYARTTHRSFWVATRDEPLVVRIDGPSWVRIDTLHGNAVHSQYRLLREAVETLSLSPTPPATEARYRIQVLRLDTGKPFIAPGFDERPLEPVAPPLSSLTVPAPPSISRATERLPLGAQEDGTRTLGVSNQRRRAAEEDSSGSLDAERFWQGDFTYRVYAPHRRTYFRTTLLGRVREYGKETYGIEQSLQYRPSRHPLNYTLTGSAFAQDGEWALDGRGSISLTRIHSPKWSHTPSASVFVRALSLDDPGPFPEEIDQDIYTDYKSEHLAGLRLREQVTYRPRRDTRVFAGGGIGTNQDFNPFDPDSVTYFAGISQLLGPVRLGAELRGHQYFADDDRTSSDSLHRLRLEAVAELWRLNQQRLEAGARWIHYDEEDDEGYLLFTQWHTGAGRRLRDFRPSEAPFSDIRERRVPHHTPTGSDDPPPRITLPTRVP